MTWDRERYLADVLEPARKAGNVPPSDLYSRYGLPASITGEAAFARQIADVTAFWRELKARRMYARLAEVMLAAHAELEKAGRLTRRSFAERFEEARRGQLERLARLAQAEAGAVTHVGPAAVARLRTAFGGAVTDDEVVSALEKAGVQVVEKFPVLPAVPHPKQADLARYLQQLGVWPSAAVVFGDAVGQGFRVLHGFRLADGRKLDEEAIAAARSKVDALPYTDPAKTASESVLAILRASVRKPGELDALLLSEVVERLRPLARSGFVQRAIAAHAHEGGLDSDEAGRIAAAMKATDDIDVLRQQVEDELAQGRLRSALRLAAGLPADDPVRERSVTLDAQVIALIRQAEEELAEGRPEQAAALLAEAMRTAGDDAELPERLAAVAPPPPGEAAARMDGDHVIISWAPSPARVGRVEYRVMRGQHRAPASPSEGTTVVTRTERGEVIDAEPPPGARLFYSVFATRGGQIWSAPAVAPPTVFAPDVTDVSVAVEDTSVAVSWRPHPGTDSVVVARREKAPPRGRDDGQAVSASLSGFAETGLCTGTEYYYTIVGCYRLPDGQRGYSAGLVVLAVPEPVLSPVADLNVSRPGDGLAVVATWTPPPYGEVMLVRDGKTQAWPLGTRIGVEEAAGLREMPGIRRRGTDGRDVLELRLPPGHHFILPLTVGRHAAVTGTVAEVLLVEPVRGLSANRVHDDVRLAWIWPDGATDALIRWPGGERHCSRRVYADEGGAQVTVGGAEATIEVDAIYPQRRGGLTAPAARVHVPARGVAVTYHIRRTSRWRPRQRTIELVVERATRIPALVVVRSTGRYVPDEPSDGETVARFGPGHVTPGQSVSFPVELAKGPAWLACFVDPSTPDAEARGILLFPPPAEEMKIR